MSFSLTDRSTRARAALLLAFSLILSLGLPLAPSAAQVFVDQGLDVELETPSGVINTTQTLTATIQTAQETPVNIDFEITSGPNDADGAGYNTPDLTCTIPANQTSCIVQFSSPQTGDNSVRAWVDTDNNNSTNQSPFPPESEVDTQEGRNETQSPGTGDQCGNEPEDPASAFDDCTDVVTVTWRNPPSEATVLDCDDAGGPDTERDVNPGGTSETYTCTVYSQTGGAMDAQTVFGENENGINDPDLNDSASYNEPDYTCETADPTGTGEFDPECTITVSPGGENELGTADICFWTESVEDSATPNEGQALCASEPVDEDQSADGSDDPDDMNDRADAVEKTWRSSNSLILECTPETDSNPTGTSHTITCTTSNLGAQTNPRLPQGGINVDIEATGANDPDSSDSRTTPDFTCTTAGDQDPLTPPVPGEGSCTFTHGPAGSGTTNDLGSTLYRAWVDDDESDATDDSDSSEGRDEVDTPGAENEPDTTDVVEKNWIVEPATLSMSPESDTAGVGSCNPYTVTVLAENNAPVEGAFIDVEQRHANASNPTSGDEPKVTFCQPTEGPNPSDVDESQGDLGAADENPDNPGTAGGQTVKATDSNGQVTFGIMSEPAGSSDGSGTVQVSAFFDENDDDDPSTGEAQDSSTKTWIQADGRTIDCTPKSATNAAGTEHKVTCTVLDRFGEPAQGEGVTFSSTGPGSVEPTQANTNAQGQAETTATSNQSGEQSITATITDDTGQGEPGDVDDCDRAANDPSGAPAGKCSDTVQKTWTGDTATARTVTLEASKNKKTYGKQFTLTATVDSSDPNAPEECTSGVTVEFERTVTGETQVEQVDTATTNSEGIASTSLVADKSATYVAHVDGTEQCGEANSSGEPVNVKKAVGLRLSDQKVRKGQRIRLRVKVKPCGPPDGQGHQKDRVVLYKRVRGSFAKIDSARTNNDCVAVFRKRIRKDSVFQARSPKQDADHLGGRSRKKAVQVR